MKPKAPRYEKAINGIAELAQASQHPLFILNVNAIVNVLRKDRPKTTPLAIQLIRMALAELVSERIDSCRVLLLTALAVVDNRTFKMLSSFAGKMLVESVMVKKSMQGKHLPPLPPIPGVPPQFVNALNAALTAINPDELPEGKTTVQTGVGPMEVLKIKNPTEKPKFGGGNPSLN